MGRAPEVATVSGLFWYTDVGSAKNAARKYGRPILHLRMLGKLDEELSCANSRLFRATLYANQDVSRFLRERFILYWSSERPVPHVTIDYGEGRRLERTATGNSAHYILDGHGNVLDVLPGLYAPTAFVRELEGSLALAASVRDKSDANARSCSSTTTGNVIAAERDWAGLAGMRWIPGAAQLLTRSPLAEAQLRTTPRSYRDARRALFREGTAPEAVSEDQDREWATAGQVLYGIGI